MYNDMLGDSTKRFSPDWWVLS